MNLGNFTADLSSPLDPTIVERLAITAGVTMDPIATSVDIDLDASAFPGVASVPVITVPLSREQYGVVPDDLVHFLLSVVNSASSSSAGNNTALRTWMDSNDDAHFLCCDWCCDTYHSSHVRRLHSRDGRSLGYFCDECYHKHFDKCGMCHTAYIFREGKNPMGQGCCPDCEDDSTNGEDAVDVVWW